MPKSRRVKAAALTKTDSKGAKLKADLVKNVRDSVDTYANIFTFSYENMRSTRFKKVRADFKESRFFMGKNKVMQVALGRDETDEHRAELSKLAAAMAGNGGLLFTDRDREFVEKYFSEFEETDFARAGADATEEVVLDEGPLRTMPPNMLEPLRQLGMPVRLAKGVVMLDGNYTVCREGETLSPNQAQILKLFGIEMAEFKITIDGMWHDDKFTALAPEDDAE